MFKYLLLSVALFANTLGANFLASNFQQSAFRASASSTPAVGSDLINQLPIPKTIPVLSNLDQLDNQMQAQVYLVYDVDSATVLAQRNGETKRSFASAIKLLTALIVAERDPLDKTVTVSHTAAYQTGSIAGLKEGDQFTTLSLLYAMLLPSGNDAAYALAESTAGSKDAFVALMNQKAADLGLTETKVSDPAGLDEANTTSTAFDMAKLLSVALKNKTVAGIINSAQLDIQTIDGKHKLSLTNSNKLVAGAYPGNLGGKTGTGSDTSLGGAGHVLVDAASRDNRTLIGVIAGTYSITHEASANEMKKLLDFSFANVK